jgi:hypothetical protein
MEIVTPASQTIEGVICLVSITLCVISLLATLVSKCHWMVPIIFALESAEHGIALALGDLAYLRVPGAQATGVAVPWIKLMTWVATCPILLRAVHLLDPQLYRPPTPARRRSGRVAFVDPAFVPREITVCGACLVSLSQWVAQPLALGISRSAGLQCTAIVVMVGLSIIALETSMAWAAITAIIVSFISGISALVLLFAEATAVSRNCRPELEHLPWRFSKALVMSWTLYPIIFCLGPGMGNILPLSSMIAGFSALDLLAKNGFVAWAWAASDRVKRLELSIGDAV